MSHEKVEAAGGLCHWRLALGAARANMWRPKLMGVTNRGR